MSHILLPRYILLSSKSNASHCISPGLSFERCFLISHAHFDHISGLVLSAGSLSGGRKRVYALKNTLDSIASVFNDRLWPNLASFDERDERSKLHLCPSVSTPFPGFVPNVIFACSLRLGQPRYTQIHASVSVLPLRLSHGVSSQDSRMQVLSTAFFLRHDPTQKEILFFGDVEPDALSLNPMNLSVWRTAAPKIPHALSAIFIECSWASERSDDTLYGHLSPPHLLDELLVLATEVWKVRTTQSSGRSLLQRMKLTTGKSLSPSSEELRGILDGLSIYIIHCKSDLTSERPARNLIEKQIKELMQQKGLGANILAVEQGSILHL